MCVKYVAKTEVKVFILYMFLDFLPSTVFLHQKKDTKFPFSLYNGYNYPTKWLHILRLPLLTTIRETWWFFLYHLIDSVI